jgi:hypothetical protein
MNLIIACAIAGLISLILGFVWYHPKVFGTAWMKETGLTEEKIQSGNMAVTFGLTFLITMYMAYEMKWVNHSDELNPFIHGMYHGVCNIGVFAFGAIIINGLMEQKSIQYIFINVGYWLVLFALIGGMFASFPSFKPKKSEETSLKIDFDAIKTITANSPQEYRLKTRG